MTKVKELSKAEVAVLLKKNTRGSRVNATEYIKDHVKHLRGAHPLPPKAVADNLGIKEPKARYTSLSVMRKNIDQMIGVFQRQSRGAPKLSALFAGAPLEEQIVAYEYYQGKAIRMTGRWSTISNGCEKVLRRLRRQRVAGVRLAPAPAVSLVALQRQQLRGKTNGAPLRVQRALKGTA